MMSTPITAAVATAKAKAQFILATDGETVKAEDLESDDPPVVCTYRDFPDHFGFFLPLAGIPTVKQVRESSIDIRATSRLNRLYVRTSERQPRMGNRRAPARH